MSAGKAPGWTCLLLASMSMACGGAENGLERAAETSHKEAEIRGPNGGRLMTSGAFELELEVLELNFSCALGHAVARVPLELLDDSVVTFELQPQVAAVDAARAVLEKQDRVVH